MEATLERITALVQPVLESWESVDTVTMLTFGTDRYDPSFFLSYDVFFYGAPLAPTERERSFPDADAFESTVDGQKDRFLLDDVPVRLEYKAVSDMDAQVAAVSRPFGGDVGVSTYGLYRLLKGTVIFARSNWLAVARRELEHVPETFWERRIQLYRGRMEHALSDLSSAVFAGENLFYHLALAGFLDKVCALLFALNRRFEPAGRGMAAEIETLAMLPEEFDTRFSLLLRDDASVSGKRKREVAQLIAKSLLRIS